MIDIADDQRQRAFGAWLRTGRLPSGARADAIEVTFNPWHDPANGRFTFSGSGHRGRWGGVGFTGGGGRFGGGGATAIWGQPEPKRSPAARQSPARIAPSPGQAGAAGRPPVRPADSPTEAFRTIVRNGYAYQIDAKARTRRVSGALTTAALPIQSRASQARAGGARRRAGDDGGHYIAARFNGPTEASNHFAQNANVNRGGYRLLEVEWARDKRAGGAVTVKIVPTFEDISARPSVIDVWWTVDGKRKSLKFPKK